MGVSNKERIDKALTILCQALYPYVEQRMQAKYKDTWLDQAKSSLKDNYKDRIMAEVLREDLYALLTVMLKEWEKVFKDNLGSSERRLVNEVKDARNDWAHRYTFASDDTYRILDSIERLLKAISASELNIKEVETGKRKVLQFLNKEQDRKENRRVAAGEERIREKLAELLQKLPFQDACLLLQALTHRSYMFENPKSGEDNERLEFLGDAVLGFVISEFLYSLESDAELDEGKLTQLRAQLVSEAQLAKFARDLNLAKWMRLGKGEQSSGGHTKASLLSNIFEAVIGAYFLDSGIDMVGEFLKPLFESAIKNLGNFESDIHPTNIVDNKNRFQEWVHANVSPNPPKYVTVNAGGLPHAPEFLSKVYVGEKLYGEGKGRSKKDAEKRAAEDALSKLKTHTP
jgi:ribonuclease-3